MVPQQTGCFDSQQQSPPSSGSWSPQQIGQMSGQLQAPPAQESGSPSPATARRAMKTSSTRPTCGDAAAPKSGAGNLFISGGFCCAASIAAAQAGPRSGPQLSQGTPLRSGAADLLGAAAPALSPKQGRRWGSSTPCCRAGRPEDATQAQHRMQRRIAIVNQCPMSMDTKQSMSRDASVCGMGGAEKCASDGQQPTQNAHSRRHRQEGRRRSSTCRRIWCRAGWTSVVVGTGSVGPSAGAAGALRCTCQSCSPCRRRGRSHPAGSRTDCCPPRAACVPAHPTTIPTSSSRSWNQRCAIVPSFHRFVVPVRHWIARAIQHTGRGQ